MRPTQSRSRKPFLEPFCAAVLGFLDVQQRQAGDRPHHQSGQGHVHHPGRHYEVDSEWLNAPDKPPNSTHPEVLGPGDRHRVGPLVRIAAMMSDSPRRWGSVAHRRSGAHSPAGRGRECPHRPPGPTLPGSSLTVERRLLSSPNASTAVLQPPPPGPPPRRPMPTC